MLPSVQEMLPILVLLLIIFGARKLPEIGAGLGKGIKEFKKSVKDEDESKDSGSAKAVEDKGSAVNNDNVSENKEKKEV